MSKANTEPWSLITPPCDGVVYVDCKYWRLDHKSLTSLMQDIDEPLRKLSGYGSSVYYLWSERVSGEHGYAFWQGGDLKRAVLSSQREFSTLGQPYDNEPEFDFFEINNGKPKKNLIKNNPDYYFYLSEHHIFELADRWGVNQLRIPPLEPNEIAHCWIADLPFWLRRK